VTLVGRVVVVANRVRVLVMLVVRNVRVVVVRERVRHFAADVELAFELRVVLRWGHGWVVRGATSGCGAAVSVHACSGGADGVSGNVVGQGIGRCRGTFGVRAERGFAAPLVPAALAFKADRNSAQGALDVGASRASDMNRVGGGGITLGCAFERVTLQAIPVPAANLLCAR